MLSQIIDVAGDIIRLVFQFKYALEIETFEYLKNKTLFFIQILHKYILQCTPSI